MNDEKRILELALSHYLMQGHPLPFIDQVAFYIANHYESYGFLLYLCGDENGHNLDLTRVPTPQDIDAFVKALIYIVNKDDYSFSLSYAQDFNNRTWSTMKLNHTAQEIHSEGHLEILFITLQMLIKKHWKQPVKEADMPSHVDGKARSIIFQLYTKTKDFIKTHPHAPK